MKVDTSINRCKGTNEAWYSSYVSFDDTDDVQIRQKYFSGMAWHLGSINATSVTVTPVGKDAFVLLYKGIDAKQLNG